MNDLTKIEAATIVPEWTIEPSPFDWQVMLFGGVNPRNGIEWLPLGFQFFKQQREGGAGHDLRRVIRKAEAMAECQHRPFYAVRDTDGSVVHVGECRLWSAVA